MLVMAWPDCVRRAHALYESPSFANISGTLRMPALPSAWHDWQAFFTVSTHWSCDFMFSEMPLPLSPVPGNWSAAGIFSIEYQYMPGYSSAVSFALPAMRTLNFMLLPGAADCLSESESP